MKTKEEILAKIKELEANEDDWMGTMRTDLIHFLPLELAKEYLKPEITEESWQESYTEPTEENVKAKMLDYMPFAWDKANNCRGLSAGRSIEHMYIWLWILDNPLALDLKEQYALYGKPQLKQICEKFGWNWRQWHNGMTGNAEDKQVENVEII